MAAVCAVTLAAYYAAPVQAQPVSGERFSCSADNIGATLTKLTCDRSPGDLRWFLTDIVAQSTTATGGQMILRYGTGTNCGTGTTSIFPSAATAVRFGYPGNAIAPTVVNLLTPVVLPKGVDLCVLGVATNTVTIQVTGYAAP